MAIYTNVWRILVIQFCPHSIAAEKLVIIAIALCGPSTINFQMPMWVSIWERERKRERERQTDRQRDTDKKRQRERDPLRRRMDMEDGDTPRLIAGGQSADGICPFQWLWGSHYTKRYDSNRAGAIISSTQAMNTACSTTKINADILQRHRWFNTDNGGWQAKDQPFRWSYVSRMTHFHHPC